MRPASWIPPAVWMGVIMALSSGAFSSRHTGGALVAVLAWVAPWLAPADVVGLHGALRKTAHFVEYGILALLWFRGLARDTSLSHPVTAAATFGICLAWAALDELHQRFVPTRTGSFGDVAIDAAGALAALAIARRDWPSTVSALTSVLLWLAALGGALVLTVNWATGVRSGYLWVAAPAAGLALAWRRRWTRRPQPAVADEAGSAAQAGEPRP